MDMKFKGVCYDVGRIMMGNNWRPIFDPNVVHRELEIIKNDLHCNSVRICGLDIDRLIIATKDALEQGLEVWLSPERWDESQEKTHNHILKTAKAAEELCKQWPENLVFIVGSELTLFMQGIFEGDNFLERIKNPSFWNNIKEGTHNKLLNDFLFKTNKEIRQVFSGKVTYASAPLETVDWSLFDFVCVDMYRDSYVKDSYGDIIKQYFNYKKPVVISEFGCCTYQGAEDAGSMGFLIVDLS
jgi:hypothetical protein